MNELRALKPYNLLLTGFLLIILLVPAFWQSTFTACLCAPINHTKPLEKTQKPGNPPDFSKISLHNST
jgi:hypothetical protein